MPLVNVLINSTNAGVGSGNNIQRGQAAPSIDLDYLVVGGGAYGTYGAGGGGGVVSGSIRLIPRFTIDVTVGAGGIGTGSISESVPAQSSIIQIDSRDFYVYAGSGSIAYSGYPQLNGPGTSSSNYSQGGAGGASSIGGNTTSNDSIGGNGGSGSQWINNMYYGGGGGGYGTFFIPGEARGGAGGIGGGGVGNGFTTYAASGTPNTGGGAGGGASAPFTYTSGGSGVVILRYTSGSVMGVTGGTVQITGSNVYHVFTGSGQFRYY